MTPLRIPTRRHGLAGLALGLAACAHAQVGPPTACGSLEASYGPYDYRTNRADIVVVEKFHFTPIVERLIDGQSGRLGQDIDYTLRASPNHHRALAAMAKLGEKLKVPKVPFTTYEVECYFVRATQFRRDDVTVRMLYANYLKKQQRLQEAVHQLDVASEFASDFAFTHYNLGLSYFDLGVMDKAQKHARLALEAGFPRTELKDALAKAGAWTEAPEAAASAASAPAAAASGAAR